MTTIPANFKGAAAPLSATGVAKAAVALQCDIAAVKAVAQVETGGRPYFDKQGRPYILFESAKFSKFTCGRYDKSHPSISKPSWVKDYGSLEGQYTRLEMAMTLEPEAALKAASWGAFQIMGFNHKLCGYQNVNDLVTAMCDSADKQLDAFVKFVQSNVLGHYLKDHRWADFAHGYNGASFADNHYDTKLADAYLKFSGER